MIKHIFLVLLLVWLCTAAPAGCGIRFDKRDGALPFLTLPYGTWQATKYDPNGDIYTFKNIRYGAPPIGGLRWAKPAPPAQENTIQDGSYGPVCIQTAIKPELLGGIPLPSFSGTSEDCLFLDIYVPAKAINNSSLKLPVISWFYGGFYRFGGKDQFEPLLPFYDGTGLIQASDGNVIFVTSNYRVGAFGFLAGTTMENEGLPNAGLYDQRAVLQWIQDHISLIGGDKSQVSAWGESAGAGSILHHLTAFGGTQDPLFSRAVLQSPAYKFLIDRKGSLEQTFQDFAGFAGCAGQGVSCLRNANTKVLSDANEALSEADTASSIGPSADGTFVRQLAPLEFASGNYWKGLSSIILSHTSKEGDIVVDNTIQTDQGFNDFVNKVLPAYSETAGVNAAIEAQYPPVMNGTNRKYSNERERLIDLLQDSSFQCNVRYLSDAYKGKNWNIQYSATTGLHGVDIVPTFYSLNIDVSIFGTKTSLPLVPGFGSFAQAYQSYLVSHARTGNPNTFKKPFFNLPPAIPWPQPGNTGDALTNVLDATDLGFIYITDDLTRKSRCGFWEDVAAAVTGLGGYAPPDSVVPTTLVPVTNDPSANYGRT